MNGITAMVAQLQSALPPDRQRSPNLPLTPWDRDEIRAMLASGMSSKEVAQRTGVSYTRVQDIKKGRA